MSKKREKPFHLDMSLDEALKRFVQTDPRELADKKKKVKRKRTVQTRQSIVPPQKPYDHQ